MWPNDAARVFRKYEGHSNCFRCFFGIDTVTVWPVRCKMDVAASDMNHRFNVRSCVDRKSDGHGFAWEYEAGHWYRRGTRDQCLRPSTKSRSWRRLVGKHTHQKMAALKFASPGNKENAAACNTPSNPLPDTALR